MSNEKFNPPKAPRNSANTVFNIPELLEQILLRLADNNQVSPDSSHIHDIICCRRVSRTFKATIEGSCKLRYLSLLDYTTTTPRNEPSEEPIEAQKERPAPRLNTAINNIYGKSFLAKNGMCWKLWVEIDEYGHIDLDFRECEWDASIKKLSKEALLRQMPLTETDTRVYIRVRTMGSKIQDGDGGAMWQYGGRLESGWVKKGALIGEVLRWVEMWGKGEARKSDVVYRMRMCGGRDSSWGAGLWDVRSRGGVREVSRRRVS